MNCCADTLNWIWFDLDDTIIDFHANAREALTELYVTERLNRYFNSPEEWIEHYEFHNARLWERYSRGEISQDFLRESRFSFPFIDAGVSADEAAIMSHRFDPLYLDRLSLGTHMIDGAMDLLRTVASHPGLKTGIISNGFVEVQHRKIDRVGIRDMIDLIVLSDDIGINKPDIRIFRHAMELSQQPDPSRHIMIGDNPATDIRGASNAGWKCFWLDNGHFPSPDLPSDVTRIKSLRELLTHHF